jgi:hypothetical protein
MDIGCHYALGLSGGYGIQSSPADFNWDGVVDELDLALMNVCMGATNEPNLVAMDMDYDSWVNLGDFGFYAYDYGWASDPNVSLNGDPNSVRSDFNKDGVVDFEDLEVLAELWLTPVFDEYRICSLCNLHTGGDPNDPNAPAGREVIDANDMAAFMTEWGVSTDIDCHITFETADSNSVEPNRLSGAITILVDDCLPSTWMFLQVDGVPAGETYADTGLPLFTMPTYEFSNGYHLLTVGGYTHQDGCWIQRFPALFDNRLYYASIPDMYEPNELYEITGFFDGGSVEISTDPNSSTFSDNGYIKHSSIINSASAEAILTYENGMSAETQQYALTAAVDLSTEDPNSWRAVIIAPNKKINNAAEDEYLPDNRLLTAIRETLEAANIPYKELLEKNAHWDNIKTALTAPNMNYVYWIGHMDSYVGRVIDKDTGQVLIPGVQRTHFTCWDKKRLKPAEAHILSWVKSDRTNVPPNISIPDLPSDWDTRGISMTSLKLWQTKKIKEFWAIGCQSAVKWETADQNDMALAVGVYNYKDIAGHYTHIYIGNKIDVMPGGASNFLLGYPRALSKIIRRHRTTNLGNALVTDDLTDTEQRLLWGPDGDRDGYADNMLQWWPSDIELDRVIFQ